MKNSIWLPALLAVLIIGQSCTQSTGNPDMIEPVTQMDSISYIIGYDYGVGIRSQEINVDPVMVYKGLYDALKKDRGLFDEATQARLIEEFNVELEEIEQKRFQEMLAINKREGQRFLDENRSRDGVMELPSGLQYKVLKLGNGDYPALTDSITIHYRAMYLDRTTFDMSYDVGPVGIRLNHLVKGLSEGILLMRPGAIFEFYIPSHIAYGDRNYLDLVPAGSTVIYSVELIQLHNK